MREGKKNRKKVIGGGNPIILKLQLHTGVWLALKKCLDGNIVITYTNSTDQ